MNFDTPRLIKKTISCAVTAALLITAPGLPCYQAMAQFSRGGGRALGSSSVGRNLAARSAVAGATLAQSGMSLSRMGTLANLLVSPQISVSLNQGMASQGVPASALSAVQIAANAFEFLPSVSNGVPGSPTISPVQNQMLLQEASMEGEARTKARAAAPTFATLEAALAQNRLAHSFLGVWPRVFDRNALSAQRVPVLSGSRGLSGGRLAAAGFSEGREGSDRSGTPAPAVAQPDPLKAQTLWRVFTLAGLGAAAGHYGALYLLLGYPALIHWSIVAGGVILGIIVSQRGTWANFGHKVMDAARTTAGTAFRFWARFGLSSRAYVLGESIEEALNAPLPKNFFSYPKGAWPFLLVSYGAIQALAAAALLALGWSITSWPFWVLVPMAVGSVPAMFVVGFLYRPVTAPFVALIRGLKQIVVDFVPWLKDLVQKLKKAWPFLKGFAWGGLKGWGLSIGIGALLLARPMIVHVWAFDYHPRSVPAWIGFGLLKLAGLLGIIPVLVLGLGMGFVFGAFVAILHALQLGLEYAGSQGKAAKFSAAWFKSLTAWERGFEILGEYGFTRPEKSTPNVLRSGWVRLLNVPAQTLYMILVIVLLGPIAFVRSGVRAWRFLKTEQLPRLVPLLEVPEARPLSPGERRRDAILSALSAEAVP